MIMKTATFYLDFKNNTSHMIIAEVNTENGAHRVVQSDIHIFESTTIKVVLEFYRLKLTPANVRVYRVEEANDL